MSILRRQPIDAEIFRLAVPALGALTAEPLFLLVDTALVGHLGAVPLAGVSIASAVLQTAVGLLIFLAYSTTPQVARRLGSGDRTGAMQAGVAGLWLAIAIGAVLVAAGVPSARWLVSLFSAPDDVLAMATTYLSISLWGLPAVLITFAATGLLRGLQDTVTPLVIAGVGFAANAALNVLFIYGLGWSIAGSAIGTVAASWGMAAAYILVVLRAARAARSSLAPRRAGLLAAANSGAWLLLRTAALRVAMLATVVVGAQFGVRELATLQIALTMFGALALALDAFAIAGQALVGRGLGASDVALVRSTSRRLVEIGVLSGAVLGILLAASSPIIGTVFTNDSVIRDQLAATVLLMAVGLPLAGIVFVLDGVLIGAGDARYLALTGLINLAVYLPLLFLVSAAGLDGTPALLALWAAFGFGYLGARMVTLAVRARGDAWMVTGA